MGLYDKQVEGISRNIFLYSASVLVPPNNQEITDWAEDSLELSARVTRFPGRLKIKSLTPYLERPLNGMKHFPKVVCIFGAQTGKTLIIQAFNAWIIDQCPGPSLIVYPNQDMCKRRSVKHIRPLLEDSPVLRCHVLNPREDLQIFTYFLDRMDVLFAWSGSETMLAAEPICNLTCDEFAKYDYGALGKAEARTRSYGWMARKLFATTPKTKEDPGYTEYINGTQEHLHVPCLACGELQQVLFKSIVFPQQQEGEDFSRYIVRLVSEVRFKCRKCGHLHSELDKPDLLQAHNWVPDNPGAGYISLQMPAWLSPWYRFSDAVIDFLKAKDDPAELQNWVNDTCGEFWDDKVESADKTRVLQHRQNYEPMTIPTMDNVICVITTDVQKDYIVYLVRAHTLKHSWLLDFGSCATLADSYDLKNRLFRNQDLRDFSCAWQLVDSGYRTGEVYEYVLTAPRLIATKGQEGQQSAPIRWQAIKKYPGSERELPGTVNLMHIDSEYFKDELLMCIDRGFDADSKYNDDFSDWHLHRLTGESYAAQICAEAAIEEKDKRNRIKRYWKRLSKENHYLDLEVMQLAARYLLRDELRRMITPPKAVETYTQPPPEGWR